jgi:rfaE bifunctional protein nucleotidyltransferase chain/domain
MSYIELMQKKIIPPEQLDYTIALWRFKEFRVVFTNGCFDIIHRGHIEYLAKARELGDILVVGLNTDESVKRIKGDGRPLQDQESRALILASLNLVAAVILFNEDTPYELIKKIQPDVLVKGGDYKPEEIVGYDIVQKKGGTVKTIEFIDGLSSSSIIRKLDGI